MTDNPEVERVKKLSVRRLDASSVRFRASLDDTCHGTAGDEVIHSLGIEGTISLPELVILTITPFSNKQPYPECARSLDPVRQLAGARIGPGFRSRIIELMGRSKGCTHFLTLALDVAASHTLTVFLRMREKASYADRENPDGAWLGTGFKIEPNLENACIGLTSDSRPVVLAKRYAKNNP